ncbi:MAG: HAD family phosphatase, partial [Spirulinaceae cyanobacterium RM2_2_10]|nr:HAD family phosphatase [Spirulinaceae cyanobacterium RM2_2_10]
MPDMLTAILFDLDGTLVNTDPLHFRAWQATLASFGRDLDQAGYDRYISGRQNVEILQDLLPQLSVAEAEEVARQKEAHFRQLAADLQPLAGVDRILDWVAARQLKKAVVSNAPRANAEFMLAALKLAPLFPLVVLGEDAVRGKPDPAPYCLALERLEVTAAQ